MDFIASRLIDFFLVAPALIITVTLHEFMHGFVSDRLGDPTPREAGRLTLNPLKHLDPLGSLMILLVHFGWGKPMPIDPSHYKNPRLGMMYTAAAGPLTNFAIAAVIGIIVQVGNITPNGLLSALFIYTAVISVYLGVFNLIPIPPLDGSKVLAAFLPERILPSYFQLEQYGIPIIFLGFYFLGASSFLAPIASFISRALGVPYL